MTAIGGLTNFRWVTDEEKSTKDKSVGKLVKDATPHGIAELIAPFATGAGDIVMANIYGRTQELRDGKVTKTESFRVEDRAALAREIGKIGSLYEPENQKLLADTLGTFAIKHNINGILRATFTVDGMSMTATVTRNKNENYRTSGELIAPFATEEGDIVNASVAGIIMRGHKIVASYSYQRAKLAGRIGAITNLERNEGKVRLEQTIKEFVKEEKGNFLINAQYQINGISYTVQAGYNKEIHTYVAHTYEPHAFASGEIALAEISSDNPYHQRKMLSSGSRASLAVLLGALDLREGEKEGEPTIGDIARAFDINISIPKISMLVNADGKLVMADVRIEVNHSGKKTIIFTDSDKFLKEAGLTQSKNGLKAIEGLADSLCKYHQAGIVIEVDNIKVIRGENMGIVLHAAYAEGEKVKNAYSWQQNDVDKLQDKIGGPSAKKELTRFGKIRLQAELANAFLTTSARQAMKNGFGSWIAVGWNGILGAVWNFAYHVGCAVVNGFKAGLGGGVTFAAGVVRWLVTGKTDWMKTGWSMSKTGPRRILQHFACAIIGLGWNVDINKDGWGIHLAELDTGLIKGISYKAIYRNLYKGIIVEGFFENARNKWFAAKVSFASEGAKELFTELTESSKELSDYIETDVNFTLKDAVVINGIACDVYGGAVYNRERKGQINSFMKVDATELAEKEGERNFKGVFDGVHYFMDKIRPNKMNAIQRDLTLEFGREVGVVNKGCVTIENTADGGFVVADLTIGSDGTNVVIQGAEKVVILPAEGEERNGTKIVMPLAKALEKAIRQEDKRGVSMLISGKGIQTFLDGRLTADATLHFSHAKDRNKEVFLAIDCIYDKASRKVSFGKFADMTRKIDVEDMRLIKSGNATVSISVRNMNQVVIDVVGYKEELTGVEGKVHKGTRWVRFAKTYTFSIKGKGDIHADYDVATRRERMDSFGRVHSEYFGEVSMRESSLEHAFANIKNSFKMVGVCLVEGAKLLGDMVIRGSSFILVNVIKLFTDATTPGAGFGVTSGLTLDSLQNSYDNIANRITEGEASKFEKGYYTTIDATLAGAPFLELFVAIDMDEAASGISRQTRNAIAITSSVVVAILMIPVTGGTGSLALAMKDLVQVGARAIVTGLKKAAVALVRNIKLFITHAGRVGFGKASKLMAYKFGKAVTEFIESFGRGGVRYAWRKGLEGARIGFGGKTISDQVKFVNAFARVVGRAQNIWTSFRVGIQRLFTSSGGSYSNVLKAAVAAFTKMCGAGPGYAGCSSIAQKVVYAMVRSATLVLEIPARIVIALTTRPVLFAKNIVAGFKNKPFLHISLKGNMALNRWVAKIGYKIGNSLSPFTTASAKTSILESYSWLPRVAGETTSAIKAAFVLGLRNAPISMGSSILLRVVNWTGTLFGKVGRAFVKEIPLGRFLSAAISKTTGVIGRLFVKGTIPKLTLTIYNHTKSFFGKILESGMQSARLWSGVSMLVYDGQILYGTMTGNVQKFSWRDFAMAGYSGFMSGFAFGAAVRTVAIVLTSKAFFIIGKPVAFTVSSAAKAPVGIRAPAIILGTTVYVYRKDMDKHETSRDCMVSIAKGLILGWVIAYAVSPTGIKHFGQIQSKVARFASPKMVRAAQPGIEAMTEGTLNLVAASAHGAVEWIIITPMFSVFGSIYSAVAKTVVTAFNKWRKGTGEIAPLKFELETAEGLVSVFSLEAMNVIAQNMIQAPLHGLWMGVMVGLFSRMEYRKATSIKPALSSKGLVRKTIFGAKALYTRVFKGKLAYRDFLTKHYVTMAEGLYRGVDIISRALLKADSLAFTAAYVTGVHTVLAFFTKESEVKDEKLREHALSKAVGFSAMQANVLGWVFLFMKPHYQLSKDTMLILMTASGSDPKITRDIINEFEAKGGGIKTLIDMLVKRQTTVGNIKTRAGELYANRNALDIDARIKSANEEFGTKLTRENLTSKSSIMNALSEGNTVKAHALLSSACIAFIQRSMGAKDTSEHLLTDADIVRILSAKENTIEGLHKLGGIRFRTGDLVEIAMRKVLSSIIGDQLGPESLAKLIELSKKGPITYKNQSITLSERAQQALLNIVLPAINTILAAYVGAGNCLELAENIISQLRAGAQYVKVTIGMSEITLKGDAAKILIKSAFRIAFSAENLARNISSQKALKSSGSLDEFGRARLEILSEVIAKQSFAKDMDAVAEAFVGTAEGDITKVTLNDGTEITDKQTIKNMRLVIIAITLSLRFEVAKELDARNSSIIAKMKDTIEVSRDITAIILAGIVLKEDGVTPKNETEIKSLIESATGRPGQEKSIELLKEFGGIFSLRGDMQLRGVNAGDLAHNLLVMWDGKADQKGLKARYTELNDTGRIDGIKAKYDTAKQKAETALLRETNHANYLNTLDNAEYFKNISGKETAIRAIAAAEVMATKIMGPEFKLDVQQKMMLLLGLRNITVGMNVGTGKTFSVVMDIMVKRMILRNEFRGRIICDGDARTQYAEKGGDYRKMLESVGLNPINVTKEYAQGKGARAETIAGWYNDPKVLIVISSETQAHLVNQWKDSPVLKNAMLKPSCIVIDEFHETLQSRMSAIVSEGTRMFDTSDPELKAMYDRAKTIFNAVKELRGHITDNETEYNRLKATDGIAAIVDRNTGEVFMTRKFAEALINKGLDIKADGKRGSESHMVQQALRVVFLEKGVSGHYALEKGIIRPVSDEGVQKNSTFQDTWLQLFIAIKEGKSPDTCVQIGKTTIQASLAFSLVGMFSLVYGTSATIEGLHGLTYARMGGAMQNLSAGGLHRMMEQKLFASGTLNMNNFGDLVKTRDMNVEDVLTFVRQELTRDRGVMITDPLLSSEKVSTFRTALEKEFGKIVKVIDNTTENAADIAKSMQGGEIVIVGRKGFMGLNYGEDAGLRGIGKKFHATMLILNADMIKSDVLTQLMGRIGRFKENVSFRFQINMDRMTENLGRLLGENNNVIDKMLETFGKQGSDSYEAGLLNRIKSNDGLRSSLTSASTLKDSPELLYQALMLNASFRLYTAVSEGAKFNISDSLKTFMVVGFLRSFLEMPGVSKSDRMVAQAKLESVLNFEAPEVDLSEKIGRKEGFGDLFVKGTVTSILQMAYRTTDYMASRVKSEKGKELVEFQFARLGALGERTGEMKGFDSIPVLPEMSFARCISFKELVGVAKVLSRDILPSVSIERTSSTERVINAVRSVESEFSTSTRGLSDYEIVAKASEALMAPTLAKRAEIWGGFILDSLLMPGEDHDMHGFMRQIIAENDFGSVIPSVTGLDNRKILAAGYAVYAMTRDDARFTPQATRALCSSLTRLMDFGDTKASSEFGNKLFELMLFAADPRFYGTIGSAMAGLAASGQFDNIAFDKLYEAARTPEGLLSVQGLDGKTVSMLKKIKTRKASLERARDKYYKAIGVSGIDPQRAGSDAFRTSFEVAKHPTVLFAMLRFGIAERRLGGYKSEKGAYFGLYKKYLNRTTNTAINVKKALPNISDAQAIAVALVAASEVYMPGRVNIANLGRALSRIEVASLPDSLIRKISFDVLSSIAVKKDTRDNIPELDNVPEQLKARLAGMLTMPRTDFEMDRAIVQFVINGKIDDKEPATYKEKFDKHTNLVQALANRGYSQLAFSLDIFKIAVPWMTPQDFGDIRASISVFMEGLDKKEGDLNIESVMVEARKADIPVAEALSFVGSRYIDDDVAEFVSQNIKSGKLGAERLQAKPFSELSVADALGVAKTMTELRAKHVPFWRLEPVINACRANELNEKATNVLVYLGFARPLGVSLDSKQAMKNAEIALMLFNSVAGISSIAASQLTMLDAVSIVASESPGEELRGSISLIASIYNENPILAAELTGGLNAQDVSAKVSAIRTIESNHDYDKAALVIANAFGGYDKLTEIPVARIERFARMTAVLLSPLAKGDESQKLTAQILIAIGRGVPAQQSGSRHFLSALYKHAGNLSQDALNTPETKRELINQHVAIARQILNLGNLNGAVAELEHAVAIDKTFQKGDTLSSLTQFVNIFARAGQSVEEARMRLAVLVSQIDGRVLSAERKFGFVTRLLGNDLRLTGFMTSPSMNERVSKAASCVENLEKGISRNTAAGKVVAGIVSNMNKNEITSLTGRPGLIRNLIGIINPAILDAVNQMQHTTREMTLARIFENFMTLLIDNHDILSKTPEILEKSSQTILALALIRSGVTNENIINSIDIASLNKLSSAQKRAVISILENAPLNIPSILAEPSLLGTIIAISALKNLAGLTEKTKDELCEQVIPGLKQTVNTSAIPYSDQADVLKTIVRRLIGFLPDDLASIRLETGKNSVIKAIIGVFENKTRKEKAIACEIIASFMGIAEEVSELSQRKKAAVFNKLKNPAREGLLTDPATDFASAIIKQGSRMTFIDQVFYAIKSPVGIAAIGAIVLSAAALTICATGGSTAVFIKPLLFSGLIMGMSIFAESKFLKSRVERKTKMQKMPKAVEIGMQLLSIPMYYAWLGLPGLVMAIPTFIRLAANKFIDKMDTRFGFETESSITGTLLPSVKEALKDMPEELKKAYVKSGISLRFIHFYRENAADLQRLAGSERASTEKYLAIFAVLSAKNLNINLRLEIAHKLGLTDDIYNTLKAMSKRDKKAVSGYFDNQFATRGIEIVSRTEEKKKEEAFSYVIARSVVMSARLSFSVTMKLLEACGVVRNAAMFNMLPDEYKRTLRVKLYSALLGDSIEVAKNAARSVILDYLKGNTQAALEMIQVSNPALGQELGKLKGEMQKEAARAVILHETGAMTAEEAMQYVEIKAKDLAGAEVSIGADADEALANLRVFMVTLPDLKARIESSASPDEVSDILFSLDINTPAAGLLGAFDYGMDFARRRFASATPQEREEGDEALRDVLLPYLESRIIDIISGGYAGMKDPEKEAFVSLHVELAKASILTGRQILAENGLSALYRELRREKLTATDAYARTKDMRIRIVNGIIKAAEESAQKDPDFAYDAYEMAYNLCLRVQTGKETRVYKGMEDTVKNILQAQADIRISQHGLTQGGINFINEINADAIKATFIPAIVKALYEKAGTEKLNATYQDIILFTPGAIAPVKSLYENALLTENESLRTQCEEALGVAYAKVIEAYIGLDQFVGAMNFADTESQWSADLASRFVNITINAQLPLASALSAEANKLKESGDIDKAYDLYSYARRLLMPVYVNTVNSLMLVEVSDHDRKFIDNACDTLKDCIEGEAETLKIKGRQEDASRAISSINVDSLPELAAKLADKEHDSDRLETALLNASRMRINGLNQIPAVEKPRIEEKDIKEIENALLNSYKHDVEKAKDEHEVSAGIGDVIRRIRTFIISNIDEISGEFIVNTVNMLKEEALKVTKEEREGARAIAFMMLENNIDILRHAYNSQREEELKNALAAAGVDLVAFVIENIGIDMKAAKNVVTNLVNNYPEAFPAFLSGFASYAENNIPGNAASLAGAIDIVQFLISSLSSGVIDQGFVSKIQGLLDKLMELSETKSFGVEAAAGFLEASENRDLDKAVFESLVRSAEADSSYETASGTMRIMSSVRRPDRHMTELYTRALKVAISARGKRVDESMLIDFLYRTMDKNPQYAVSVIGVIIEMAEKALFNKEFSKAEYYYLKADEFINDISSRSTPLKPQQSAMRGIAQRLTSRDAVERFNKYLAKREINSAIGVLESSAHNEALPESVITNMAEALYGYAQNNLKSHPGDYIAALGAILDIAEEVRYIGTPRERTVGSYRFAKETVEKIYTSYFTALISEKGKTGAEAVTTRIKVAVSVLGLRGAIACLGSLALNADFERIIGRTSAYIDIIAELVNAMNAVFEEEQMPEAVTPWLETLKMLSQNGAVKKIANTQNGMAVLGAAISLMTDIASLDGLDDETTAKIHLGQWALYAETSRIDEIANAFEAIVNIELLPAYMAGVIALADRLSSEGRKDEAIRLLKSVAAKLNNIPVTVLKRIRHVSTISNATTKLIILRQAGIGKEEFMAAKNALKLIENSLSKIVALEIGEADELHTYINDFITDSMSRGGSFEVIAAIVESVIKSAMKAVEDGSISRGQALDLIRRCASEPLIECYANPAAFTMDRQWRAEFERSMLESAYKIHSANIELLSYYGIDALTGYRQSVISDDILLNFDAGHKVHDAIINNLENAIIRFAETKAYEISATFEKGYNTQENVARALNVVVIGPLSHAANIFNNDRMRAGAQALRQIGGVFTVSFSKMQNAISLLENSTEDGSGITAIALGNQSIVEAAIVAAERENGRAWEGLPVSQKLNAIAEKLGDLLNKRQKTELKNMADFHENIENLASKNDNVENVLAGLHAKAVIMKKGNFVYKFVENNGDVDAYRSGTRYQNENRLAFATEEIISTHSVKGKTILRQLRITQPRTEKFIVKQKQADSTLRNYLARSASNKNKVKKALELLASFVKTLAFEGKKMSERSDISENIGIVLDGQGMPVWIGVLDRNSVVDIRGRAELRRLNASSNEYARQFVKDEILPQLRKAGCMKDYRGRDITAEMRGLIDGLVNIPIQEEIDSVPVAHSVFAEAIANFAAKFTGTERGEKIGWIFGLLHEYAGHMGFLPGRSVKVSSDKEGRILITTESDATPYMAPLMEAIFAAGIIYTAGFLPTILAVTTVIVGGLAGFAAVVNFIGGDNLTKARKIKEKLSAGEKELLSGGEYDLTPEKPATRITQEYLEKLTQDGRNGTIRPDLTYVIRRNGSVVASITGKKALERNITKLSKWLRSHGLKKDGKLFSEDSADEDYPYEVGYVKTSDGDIVAAKEVVIRIDEDGNIIATGETSTYRKGEVTDDAHTHVHGVIDLKAHPNETSRYLGDIAALQLKIDKEVYHESYSEKIIEDNENKPFETKGGMRIFEYDNKDAPAVEKFLYKHGDRYMLAEHRNGAFRHIYTFDIAVKDVIETVSATHARPGVYEAPCAFNGLPFIGRATYQGAPPVWDITIEDNLPVISREEKLLKGVIGIEERGVRTFAPEPITVGGYAVMPPGRMTGEETPDEILNRAAEHLIAELAERSVDKKTLEELMRIASTSGMSAEQKFSRIALILKDAGVYAGNLGVVFDARDGMFDAESMMQKLNVLPGDSPIKVFFIVGSEEIDTRGAIKIVVTDDKELTNILSSELEKYEIDHNYNASIAIIESRIEIAVSNLTKAEDKFNFLIAGENEEVLKVRANMPALNMLNLMVKLASQNQATVMTIDCAKDTNEALSKLKEKLGHLLRFIPITAQEIWRYISEFITTVQATARAL